MKKTFLFFATLFICFSYANGAIVIQKQGGGTDGYDKVNEQHENSGNSLLQCKDSGNDPCKFTIQPSGGVHYASMMAFVDGQVNAGVTHGSTYIDGHLVTWNGVNSENVTITIE